MRNPARVNSTQKLDQILLQTSQAAPIFPTFGSLHPAILIIRIYGPSGRGQPFVDLKFGVEFSYKKCILRRNFEFDVNKQCSATRWDTLYIRSFRHVSTFLQKDGSRWPAGDAAPEDEDYDEFARNDDENAAVWTEPDLHVV